jgi:hypothetical protein
VIRIEEQQLMGIKRREFVQIASVAAAAGVLGACRKNPQPDPQPNPQPDPQPAPRKQTASAPQFEMTIWGSCLYVLTNGYKQVDLSFMIDTKVPNTMNIDHVPDVELTNARVKSGTVTYENGRWRLPKGVISIDPTSYAKDAGDLEVVGYGQSEKDAKCPRPEESDYKLSGFGYIPKLRAEGVTINPETWRDKIWTRIPLTKGRIDAIRPITIPGDLASWKMTGPGQTTTDAQVVTSTTQYTVGLAEAWITIVLGDGSKVVLEPVDDEKPIAVVLRAGPVSDESSVDDKGRLKHFGALYHIYEEAPELEARGELYLYERCFPKVRFKDGDPYPGDFCPGARVTVP